MSGDIFGARTGALADGSTRIRHAADAFKSEYEKMFLVVDSLVGSEWSSPAATMVRNNIIGETANLNAMYQALCGYADYCSRAATRVEDNEQAIVDGVGGGWNG